MGSRFRRLLAWVCVCALCVCAHTHPEHALPQDAASRCDPLAPVANSSEACYIVVGAGLSGAVMAERIARVLGACVCVYEQRAHIAGNCYDEVDVETGIRVSRYGAHIFHTNNERVWTYMNRFGAWRRYDHRVRACVHTRTHTHAHTAALPDTCTHVPVPVNINTVNALFNVHLRTPEDMDAWLAAETGGTPEHAVNTSEALAIARVGRRLYEMLFLPYTRKQWGRDASELDSSVLARIPVRRDHDDRYFTDKYQALPSRGYTHVIGRMLAHPRIHVQLNTSFNATLHRRRGEVLIYTGRIDGYLRDAGLPPLEYRSLTFEMTRLADVAYAQTAAVVNHPDERTPFTRIIEYKHFDEASASPGTVVVREYPSATGEPYYPVPNARNRELYATYQALASTLPGVHFVGRLASYKYFNMDEAVEAALHYFETALSPGSPRMGTAEEQALANSDPVTPIEEEEVVLSTDARVVASRIP